MFTLPSSARRVPQTACPLIHTAHTHAHTHIPQGILVKRHKFTKEDGVTFFTPVDFGVGSTVTIYGRTYHIVDADTYTREIYAANMGVEQAPSLPYPDDPVDTYRATFGLTKGAKGERCTCGH